MYTEIKIIKQVSTAEWEIELNTYDSAALVRSQRIYATALEIVGQLAEQGAIGIKAERADSSDEQIDPSTLAVLAAEQARLQTRRNVLSLAEYWRMPPDGFKPGQRVACKVIAVIGGWRDQESSLIGDWSAYWGPSDWSDEQIATSGDKISERAARALFRAIAAACRFYRG